MYTGGVRTRIVGAAFVLADAARVKFAEQLCENVSSLFVPLFPVCFGPAVSCTRLARAGCSRRVQFARR